MAGYTLVMASITVIAFGVAVLAHFRRVRLGREEDASRLAQEAVMRRRVMTCIKEEVDKS